MYAKTIRKRGATVVVEANAELMFLPSGQVGSWYRRFNDRILKFTIEATPVHNSAKRPLRPHPGPHLKETIVRGKTKAFLRAKGAKLYSAIGSRSPYAVYVDQGTDPFMAKILPPWSDGSPTLYEASWAPPRQRGTPLGPIRVSGQKARNYFATGLERGFRSMRMRSYQIPGERGVFASATQDITTYGAEALPSRGPEEQDAFKMRLREWRSWRDAAFYDYKRTFSRYASNPSKRDHERTTALLNKNLAKAAAKRQSSLDRKRKRRSSSAYRQREADRARRWREENRKAKAIKKPKTEKNETTLRSLRSRLRRAVAAEQEKFLRDNAQRGVRIIGKPTPDGFRWEDRYGRRGVHTWSGAILDLFHELARNVK